MGQTGDQGKLSHIDGQGHARMVDVSAKSSTTREAVATACVNVGDGVMDQIMTGRLPKGEALNTARVAGVMAAKRTSEWIPLCHPLPLDWIDIEFSRATDAQLLITCTARTAARTGVEMEAMTGAAAAALTVYDMVKAVDKGVEIGPIRLQSKSGGKSGDYQRD
ncbi:MAG: cyclic pyranopterin monophosphate synthase MoaC [Planctomycetota bacterium]|jgi:cyclic pyranopterin phosphate synthase